LVRRILGGIAPAAAVLMIATACKVSAPLFRHGLRPAPLVVVSTIAAVGLMA
jgi:hypothetical protein